MFLAGPGRDLSNTWVCPWLTDWLTDWALFAELREDPAHCVMSSCCSSGLLDNMWVPLELLHSQSLCCQCWAQPRIRSSLLCAFTFVGDCLHMLAPNVACAFAMDWFKTPCANISSGFRLCDYKRPEERDRLLTGAEKCAPGIYELTLATC